ncbi:ATP-binding protein [Vagococcus fluvialis]|uniref:ATP-binding protein n=1 Tax=Vagococcus fluvialis TaxID=2738 RepID=UPI003D09AEAA
MNFDLLNQVKKTSEICQFHSIPLIQLKDKRPFCTECQKEKIENNEKEMLDRAVKENHLRRTVQMLEKDSIIGDPTLWNASFDNYSTDNEETAKALKLAKIIAAKYVDKESQFNTILTGVPGVGKSHLAMSILKLVNENFDGSCLFVSISDVLRLVKDSFNNPKSKYTENNMTNLLIKADLLVLDDFGSESSFKAENTESSEYNQKFLFNVLNARTRTIITTNLTSDQMYRIYNPKIISRLHRGVDGNIIKFTQATKDKRSGISY